MVELKEVCGGSNRRIPRKEGGGGEEREREDNNLNGDRGRRKGVWWVVLWEVRTVQLIECKRMEDGKIKPQATATNGQCWCDNKLLATGTCLEHPVCGTGSRYQEYVVQ